MRQPTTPEDLYRALTATGRKSKLRRIEYRCPRRCLLLEAVETPLGILIHQNRYKLSPAQNEARSSADGRAANTYDGDRHWQERSYFLADSALSWPEPEVSQVLTCDHVLAFPLTSARLTADWGARRTEVSIHATTSGEGITLESATRRDEG